MNSLLDSLRKRPFNLDDDGVEWVRRTLQALPPRRRLAQLFNQVLLPQSQAGFDQLLAEQPGAVTQFMMGGPELGQQSLCTLAAGSDVALLASADVEGGAISMDCVSPMNNQLGMAAMALPALYERAVDVMAREAAALGINWSFTPVLDINAEFRSAIVATRSFGSDPAVIEALARIHVRAMQRNGIAATAKHWPGEGFDARDQHLVTTVNPLPMAAWREHFGRMYKTLIDDGVMSVMSAHIALPAYARSQGEQGLESFRPASISRLLNVGLLRQDLGFNGVIVSDATTMAGLGAWGARAQVLPEVIENGCDMVLFSPDLSADLDVLLQALADGRLSAARVDEAAIRVLALKAALGLHKKDRSALARPWAEVRASVATPAHLEVSEAVAAASPTLVKDVAGLLPISPARQRRVVIVTDPSRGGDGPIPAPTLILDRLLAARGFEVRPYDAASPPTPGNADLVIFLLAQESLLTRSNIYLNWVAMLGPLDKAMARSWTSIPTLLISFGQPYYLYDAPRMPCVVNAYTATEPVQRAVVRKLLGEEPFSGVSPVDAFCGLPDARF